MVFTVAVVAIVLPGEPDMFVVVGLDAAVGDGDAMGVAAEIGENLRRSAEGLLGVDDPIEATHRGQMLRRTRRDRPDRRDRRRDPRPFASKAACKRFRNRGRNNREADLTARKRGFLRPLIHREPLSESPPPGTTQ